MIQNNRQNAHQEIDHIFKELLPAQGMAERPVQVALSHRMLDAMLDDSIALCRRRDGDRKNLCLPGGRASYSVGAAPQGAANQPVLISTSSIALQNAVLEEYLPFLSSVLIEDRMTKTPIRAVLRKGKSHYVCDERLKRRLQAVDLTRKSPRQETPCCLSGIIWTWTWPSTSAATTGRVSVCPRSVTVDGRAVGTSASWRYVPRIGIKCRSATTICCWQTPSPEPGTPSSAPGVEHPDFG